MHIILINHSFSFIFYLFMHVSFILFFFFNAPATTEIYTLSLHDALPIYVYPTAIENVIRQFPGVSEFQVTVTTQREMQRSEEHTSELQSRGHLVCRLLLEKKKNKNIKNKHKKDIIRKLAIYMCNTLYTQI